MDIIMTLIEKTILKKNITATNNKAWEKMEETKDEANPIKQGNERAKPSIKVKERENEEEMKNMDSRKAGKEKFINNQMRSNYPYIIRRVHPSGGCAHV